MATGKMLITATLVSLFMVAAPSSAQQPEGKTAQAEDETRVQDVNGELLEALLKRRAEVAQSASAESKRDALDFLDRRIAEVRSRIGK